jgi:hypothetical protein
MGKEGYSSNEAASKPLLSHVIIGGLVAMFLFAVFWLHGLSINENVAFSLFLFDLLFVFLLFPLKGKLWHKLALLIMGNMVGLTFNSLFSLLETSDGETSPNIFFVVAYPVLNVIWMVVMWAIGLSILASYKK